MGTVRAEPRKKREGARAFTGRAVRTRDAFMVHAAARLGLPVPDSADLAALAPATTLAEAMTRWRATHGAGSLAEVPAGGPRLLVKAGWVTAITLLGLAFSYGTAQ